MQNNSIQILTASIVIVKTMYPRSALFSQGAAEGKRNGLGINKEVRGLTIARVKADNICLITPQQTIYHPRACNVGTHMSDTQTPPDLVRGG